MASLITLRGNGPDFAGDLSSSYVCNWNLLGYQKMAREGTRVGAEILRTKDEEGQ